MYAKTLFYQEMISDNCMKNINFESQKSELVSEKCFSKNVFCKYAEKANFS